MDIILVFPKIENGRNMKRILQQSGFSVHAVCTTGAKALQYAHDLSGGVVICGYRFSDMMYEELNNCLPDGFEMLLIAPAGFFGNGGCRDVVCLNLPLKVHELLETLQMMTGEVSGRKEKKKKQITRSREDRKVLDRAKSVLMERHCMTEEEAHRYLQKRSMDNGTGLVETAEMVLQLMKSN